MGIRPLFKWFGSKWQSARHYPAPAHSHIIEPFAGGAGYALNYADRDVTIFDSNPNVAELWKWLIGEATPGMIRDIPLDLPEGAEIRGRGLSRGQELLLKHWQRTNNYGDCWTVSPWGNKPGQWTANTRARVAEEIAAVKHWKFEVPNWGKEATWFIDPPYLYNYRYGAADFDHACLAANVSELPQSAQVIVCEAACPKTGRVPDYLPFTEFRRTVTSRRKATENHHSSEYIYVR